MEADGHSIRETYVLTRETGEICARILRRLACYADSQPGGFFFTGERGVGKTHLLRYLGTFLENLSDPEWAVFEPFLPDNAQPRVPVNSLFINIPEDPSVPLGRFLAAQLRTPKPSAPGISEKPEADLSEEEFAALIPEAVSEQAMRSVGMLVLDNISRRLDRIATPESLEREFRLLKIVTDSFAPSGVLVVLIMDEQHLKWENATGIQLTLMNSLGDSCDFIWLSRNHIVEIIASALASKNDGQKLAIRGILNRLRKKLPYFGTKAENFIDLYPIHPDVFYSLFRLRSLLPGFSPLRFVQGAIDAMSGEPAERLVTLDFLFDRIVDDLRASGKYTSLLYAYDRLQQEIVPFLKPAVQARAQLLLKGIAFLSICESQPPSVRALTNSLLIYHDADFLPSYSMTSAILMELEQKGGKYLVAEGEKQDRRYRLLDSSNRLGFPTVRDLLANEDEFALQFPLLVYEWLHSEIPDWNPDTTARALRNSQSLVSPAPGELNVPRGLVFFKSIFDPIWSPEDLVSLEESPFPWILLILSPFERFYEFEQAFRELSSGLSRLIVWHPDIPTLDETGQLRKLAAERYDLELNRPPKATSAEKEGWNKARLEAGEILQSLYVQRGRLMTASVQFSVGDEIKKQRLSGFIAGHLVFLQDAFEAGLAGSGLPQAGVAARDLESEKQWLHWAALLAGRDAIRDSNPDEAKKQVIDWWTHVESSGLAGGLVELPDSLLTIQFWDYVKSFGTYLELLRPAMIRLREGDQTFEETMAQVARSFNLEEDRLQIWKQSLENLRGFIRWVSGFERACNYLYSAVPTGQQALERIRSQLLASLDRPEHFLEALNRDTFEQRFLQFKKGYVDYYCRVHDSALHIAGREGKTESKLDHAALRNLEMLSNLPFADKNYLNRVRIIGKWVEANQCDFPVLEILESYPRCYCSFNPAGNTHLRESVTQMNALIQDGVQYFRNILRRCKTRVIQGLKTMNVDDLHARQIAALLSQRRMVLLEPRTVEILNRIIQKNSKSFQAQIRSLR